MQKNIYRTHNCGELRASDIGKTIKLAGWVDTIRNLGNIVFFTLRDHYGKTQIIHNVTPNSNLSEKILSLKTEGIVFITGTVKSRDKDINPDMPTGEIEVICTDLVIDSLVDSLPFTLNEMPGEELRLKYRFLDLRRDKLQENIKLRSQIMQEIRNYMYSKNFLEIHTPILTASSPEGARDYVVPSRLHLGKFYALPQAPQQYKQLLMCSGFDRYFQIAPCFRDEDARAGRSPGEFYQLDLEMAFATQEEVFEEIEGLFEYLNSKIKRNKKIKEFPFPRITYKDSMNEYGTDKPDLRFDLKIKNISEIFNESNFEIFSSNLGNDKSTRAIVLNNASQKPRSFFDKLETFVKEKGLKGLAYLKYAENNFSGPIAKYLSEKEKENIVNTLKLKEKDVVFIAAGKNEIVLKALGELRLKIATEENLINPNEFAFCWVVDFPMFEWNETENKLDFAHNPFSMPQGGMDALNSQKPLEILAHQYDIVCNGIELASGAIRNHRPEIMFKAFEIVGHSKETVLKKFGHMINAFQLGAPPHGGIAPGLDRIVMLYADEPNIREVIAFPLNQKAQELMMNAPSTIKEEQLKELHLKIVE